MSSRLSRFSSAKEAVAEAIKVLGGQSALAAAAGPKVKQQNVYFWLKKANEVPAEFAVGIYEATLAKGRPVFLEELCPSVDWDKARGTKGPAEMRRKAKKVPVLEGRPVGGQTARCNKYAERNNAAVEVLQRVIGNDRRGRGEH